MPNMPASSFASGAPTRYNDVKIPSDSEPTFARGYKVSKLSQQHISNSMQMAPKPGYVNIIVGMSEDVHVFTVPEDELCSKIPYFHKMFQSSFQEATTKIAILPDEHPCTIDGLLLWVFQGILNPKDFEGNECKEGLRLPFFNPPFLDGRMPDIDTEMGNIDPLIHLYGLAEIFCIPHLQDEISTFLVKRSSTSPAPTVNQMLLAYSITHPKSPLRAFMSSFLHWIIMSRIDDGETSSEILTEAFIDEDLAADVLRKLRRFEDKQAYCPQLPKHPKEMGACAWHLHVDGGVECARMQREERDRMEIQEGYEADDEKELEQISTDQMLEDLE